MNKTILYDDIKVVELSVVWFSICGSCSEIPNGSGEKVCF